MANLMSMNGYEEVMQVIFVAASYLLVGIVAGIVIYLLNAIGIYKMGKNMGLKASFISFIPIARSYALGRIAQKYVKNDGSNSAKFSIILLILEIIKGILAVAFSVSLVLAVISIVSSASNALAVDEKLVSTVLQSLIPVAVLYIALIAIALAYTIVYYVALWRVFAIYSHQNATTFLVLAIFFSILAPIFVFAIRNKEARLTLQDRTATAQ